MEQGYFVSEQDIRAIAKAAAEESAKAVAQELKEQGGIKEPLPNIVSQQWLLKHYETYGMKRSTLLERREEIIKDYGEHNPVFFKRGNVVYFDRKNLEAWLLGREIKRKEAKKTDPRLEIME